ncbi:hypothetical protein PFISCL1PPCAC_17939, partial [Pristionchus fissidentatus]
DIRRGAMTVEERQKEVDELLREEREAMDRLRSAQAVHSTALAKLEKARGFRRSIGEETSLSTLPNEITSFIFSNLKLRDRLTARVNRRLYGVEKKAGPLENLEGTDRELQVSFSN